MLYVAKTIRHHVALVGYIYLLTINLYNPLKGLLLDLGKSEVVLLACVVMDLFHGGGLVSRVVCSLVGSSSRTRNAMWLGLNTKPDLLSKLPSSILIICNMLVGSNTFSDSMLIEYTVALNSVCRVSSSRLISR